MGKLRCWLPCDASQTVVTARKSAPCWQSGRRGLGTPSVCVEAIRTCRCSSMSTSQAPMRRQVGHICLPVPQLGTRITSLRQPTHNPVKATCRTHRNQKLRRGATHRPRRRHRHRQSRRRCREDLGFRHRPVSRMSRQSWMADRTTTASNEHQ